MSTTDPNQIHDLYELYALGLLDESERLQVEEQLSSGSPEAKKRIREALENNAIVLANVAPVEPSAALRNRVLAMAGAQKRTWGWTAFFAAATAGVLGVCIYLGAGAVKRSAELALVRTQLQEISERAARTNSELAQARQVLSFLNAPETRVVTFGPRDPKPPRGRVLLNPGRGVLLIASNLPPLPSGKIYEMWVIPKNAGSKPVPAGLFQSDTAGNAIHLLERVVPADAIIAVTVEPESGSAAPTSTPLFAAGA